MPDFDLFSNNAATTLTAAITTTPTAGTTETWAVASTAAPLPQIVGAQIYTVTVGLATETDREIVDVAVINSGTSLQVTRGAEGSTVKTHASGDPFTHVVTAAFLNQLMSGLAVIQANFEINTAGPYNFAKSTYFSVQLNDVITVPAYSYQPGPIMNGFDIAIVNIPSSTDAFDLGVTVIVASLDGSNVIYLNALGNVGAETSTAEITLADLAVGDGQVGFDLTWDSEVGLSTTAGGVYGIVATFSAGWD